ncbi:MAG: enoyl-CoA hydratase/isomerase family protein [Dehalococcoidia bacterium]|nr:enoyl-CoA hydratase/isomerase family protein [Dehalococcoidia bacterium]
MSYQDLTLDFEGHVAVMTLRRPEKLNALGDVLHDEINAVCAEVDANDEVRALIITGEGRGFSAGADLTPSRPDADPDALPSQSQRLDQYGWVGRQGKTVYQLNKPTIAAVNGVAVGAGMSLALACDLRVGSPESRFKTTFIERNLSPDSGMSFFLPRIIGYARAMDLIFTSRFVMGPEALELGLLNRLVEHDQLLDESLALANQIAKWPPVAMRSAKRTVQRNLQVDLDTALINESSGLQFSGRAPHDAAESRASFIEQREPHFTGQ